VLKGTDSFMSVSFSAGVVCIPKADGYGACGCFIQTTKPHYLDADTRQEVWRWDGYDTEDVE
jgi:hypothetical protein